jgi:hypothetical protein
VKSGRTSLTKQTSELLDTGTLNFTIESRIIRELGERLVKKPEIAVIELVKNAYDADASFCEISCETSKEIEIRDDGHGMTFDEFRVGWMRIGTSSKQAHRLSRTFHRRITGEKGIGRFAVRFLGKKLHLESVSFDKGRRSKTLLIAEFDWPVFDNSEDLGKVAVPYELLQANDERSEGTTLVIRELRSDSTQIDLRSVRTASLGIVTPYQSMLRASSNGAEIPQKSMPASADPGFAVRIELPDELREDDVAGAVLDNFVLRALLDLRGDRLELKIYRRGKKRAANEIIDRYANVVGPVHADIRFFPQRKGTFADLPVEGKIARAWVKNHSGIAIFDRMFRVSPYGMQGDDWLLLSADTARRAREPRSSLAKKHFPMDEPTRVSTQLNYMLRLPYPEQLVGIVQV